MEKDIGRKEGVNVRAFVVVALCIKFRIVRLVYKSLTLTLGDSHYKKVADILAELIKRYV